MKAIPLGLTGRAEASVTEQLTAQAARSGTLAVFATPFMTALMEEAAYTALTPYLDQDQSSVGVQLNVSHLSATPVGMEVWAESEVTAVDGKKITFQVRAFDRSGLIGEGVHERVVIRSESFLQRCYGKLEEARN
ncbi:MAG: thioesterase family protein [Oscillospiraceae bacterium]|nr:thioesterase family protein [Oscillospiraceae bacterium]